MATVAVTQAFVFNLRRPKLSDRAVRQAFDLAFDFESANKNLFYGQYERLDSYFDNSELAAKGLPEGRELDAAERNSRPGPAGSFHHALQEHRERHAGAGSRQSARGREPARSGRLEARRQCPPQ